MRETVNVDADYSQFNIFVGDQVHHEGPMIAKREAESSTVFLKNMFDDNLIAITPRQFGWLSVGVHLHDEQPPDLEPEWADVSEVSMAPASRVVVSSWDPSAAGFEIALDATQSYRVRYAIAGADSVDRASEAVTERYRIDLWPAVASPATTPRHSWWGRYWFVSHVTESLSERRNHAPCTDDAEAVGLLRTVFDAIPGLSREVLDGKFSNPGFIGRRFLPHRENRDPVLANEEADVLVRRAALEYERDRPPGSE